MLCSQNARAKISIMNGGENLDFDGSTNSGTQNPERQRHSVIGSRRYHGPSDEQKYVAATDLANNPNTPEFFSEAVMANTVVPQPRKNRKKLFLIIGIILILVVGILAIIIFTLNRATNPDNSVIPNTLSAETARAFNSFANYYLTGTDSENDPTAAEKANTEIYADQMISNSEINENDRKNYFIALNDKFNAFLTSFNSEYTNSTILGDDFRSYYFYFATTTNMTDMEFLDYIYKNSKDDAIKLIENNYKISGVPETYKLYASTQRKYYELRAEIYEKIILNKCYEGKEVNNTCVSSIKISKEDEEKMTNAYNARSFVAMQLWQNARQEASDIFQRMGDLKNEQQ